MVESEINDSVEAHLLPRFFKLSQQIIARYFTWCKKINLEKLNFTKICKLISDISQFKSFIHQYKIQTISYVSSMGMRDEYLNLIEEALEISMADCKKSSELLHRLGRDAAQEQFGKILKFIFDIPRLYRRTNRELTYSPSKYVNQANTELEEIRGILESENSRNGAILKFVRAFLSELMEGYASTVTDLLDSAKKTEESLQRLKMVRTSNKNENSKSPGLSDEDKIRIQVLVDVTHFQEVCTGFGLKQSDIVQFVKVKNELDKEVGGFKIAE